MLVAELVEEDVGVQAHAIIEQFRLDAGFIGQDCFAVGAGDRVAEDEAALRRGATKAFRDACIDVDIVSRHVGGRDIPADLVVRHAACDRAQRWCTEGAEAALDREVSGFIGPAGTAGYCQAV